MANTTPVPPSPREVGGRTRTSVQVAALIPPIESVPNNVVPAALRLVTAPPARCAFGAPRRNARAEVENLEEEMEVEAHLLNRDETD